MERVRPIRTEYEYWALIEMLGAMRHSASRSFMRPGPHGGTSEQVEAFSECSRIQRELLTEIEHKFGILPPGAENHGYLDGVDIPAPPKGKRWYWPWYKAFKAQWLEAEHGNIICSACPFSRGAEHYTNAVPCSVFRGWSANLSEPHQCLMTDPRFQPDWTREKLLSEIKAKGGDNAVALFEEKERQLRAHGPLQHPSAWEAKTGTIIMDPDGWRAVNKPWDEHITRAEFEKLAAESTIKQVDPAR